MGFRPADFRVGGIYSIVSGNEYGVAKVLALTPGAVHVQLFEQHYPVRPGAAPAEALTVSIGHVPLMLEGFASWEPVLIREEPVRPEELVGFEYWVQASTE